MDKNERKAEGTLTEKRRKDGGPYERLFECFLNNFARDARFSQIYFVILSVCAIFAVHFTKDIDNCIIIVLLTICKDYGK